MKLAVSDILHEHYDGSGYTQVPQVSRTSTDSRSITSTVATK